MEERQRQQLVKENEMLEELREKFRQYRELLDEFRFEKMKYIRAQDKFDESMRVYEQLDQQDQDYPLAKQQYQKWKQMASNNYLSCQKIKEKGDSLLQEVNELRQKLDVKSGADLMEAVIAERLAENKRKLENTTCEI